MAIGEVEHGVVVGEDFADVLPAVVEFVVYAGGEEGAVGAECLQGAGREVEDLHDVLSVDPVFEGCVVDFLYLGPVCLEQGFYCLDFFEQEGCCFQQVV